MEFRHRIKELREKNNLTQKELAKRINIATSSISKIESGQLDVSREMLKNISEFFNVSSDYILGISDKEKIVENFKVIEPELNYNVDLDFIELFNHYKKSDLTKEEIKEAMDFAERMKKKR